MNKYFIFTYLFWCLNLSAQVPSVHTQDTVIVGGNEWLRCSLGQSWDGTSCHGDAKEYNFSQATLAAAELNRVGYGGKTDWRLPTARELQSLRVCITGFEPEMLDLRDGGVWVPRWCRQSSASASIEASQFPKTARGWYWTGSVYDNRASPVFGVEMWGVDFEYGLISAGGVDKTIFVRLLR